MTRVLSVAAERFPIAGTFTISRGSKTEAEVSTCTIATGGRRGRGECVPYRRYGETDRQRRRRDRRRARCDRSAALGRASLARARCRPARRATRVDCALWDLEAKIAGGRVAPTLCRPAAAAARRPPIRCRSASPEAMAAQAARQRRAGRCSRSRSAATATSRASAAVRGGRADSRHRSSTPMRAGPTTTSPQTWPPRPRSASR